MGSLVERWFGRGPDWRPPRAIEADVAEELRFHVDMATEDNVRAGMSRDEARAEALERFGDVEATTRQCVAIRRGGGATMVKVMAAVTVLAMLMTGGMFVFWQRAASAMEAARAQAEAAHMRAVEARDLALAQAQAAANGADPQIWLARYKVDDGNWRLSWAVSQELVAALPPEQAWKVMREVFPQLSQPQRLQALKPFVFHGGHEYVLEMLDLAMADPDQEVRSRARGYLIEYSFEKFDDFDPRYEAWRKSIEGKELRGVFELGLERMGRRLASVEAPALREELGELRDLTFRPACKQGVDVRRILTDSGLRTAMETLRQEAAGARPMTAFTGEDENPKPGALIEDMQRWMLLDTLGTWLESPCASSLENTDER